MRRTWSHPAAGAGLVVMWSSGFIGAELGTRDASATTLLAWRYVVAMLLVVIGALAWRAYASRRLAPEGSGTRLPHPLRLVRIGVVGLLSQATYLAGVVGGVAYGVPPGTAALVAALQPLVVVGLLAAGTRVAPSARVCLGLLVGVGGVALVVTGDLGADSGPAAAYLLPVAGMAALSIGTVLDRRWRIDEPLLQVLAVQTMCSGVALVAVAALTGHLVPPTATDFWIAVGWVVALSTVGGYGCYFLVLRQGGPTRASVLLYLTPPVTAGWAYLQFGEAPGVLALPGAALCALAVALAGRPSGVSHASCGAASSHPADRRTVARGAPDHCRPSAAR